MNHRSPNRTTALLVTGVLLLAALVTGCGLGPGGHDRTITVVLPTSAGLYEGNDVGVLGVPVGTIDSIRPARDGVHVRLRITDASVRLPADVGAAVVARSVAVDRYVELTPVYRSGPTLSDGAVIPASRTVSPVEFDEALGALQKFSTDLTRDPRTGTSLRDLLVASDTTLHGQGPQLRRTVSAVADALGEADRQSPTLIGTLRALTTLTGTLAAHQGDVRRFIAAVADAGDLLATERQRIGAAIRGLDTSIRAIERLSRDHRAALHRDLVQLTDVLEATDRSRDDLAGVLDSLPLGSQNLIRAISGDHQIRVQLDPTALTPLGPALDRICTRIEQLCGLIGALPDLTGLPGLLGNAATGVTGIFMLPRAEDR